MHLGKNLAAILMGSMLLSAAGCADGASVTGTRIAPDAPTYDGSGWAGSGNRTEPESSKETGDGSGWVGSGNDVVTDSITSGAAAGSGWAGSGN